jgi:hypothetical protein
MAQVVHECEFRVTGPDGKRYRVTAFAEPRGNVWIGWLEFSAETGDSVLRTTQETSQPTRDDVAYWASGLEPIYLDGAFRRAR